LFQADHKFLKADNEIETNFNMEENDEKRRRNISGKNYIKYNAFEEH